MHLDGLRGWAALCVVLHHGTLALDFALFSGRSRDSRAVWDIWLSGTPFFPLATIGNLAVCTFFVLSGYVLAQAYVRSRQTWPALVVRRYVRLGLPVVAGCALAWLLLWIGLTWVDAAARITHSSWLQNVKHVTSGFYELPLATFRLLFLFDRNKGSVLVNALWTMPVELSASFFILGTISIIQRMIGTSERVVGFVFAVVTVLWIGSYLSLFAFGASLRLLAPRGLYSYLGARRWRLAALVAGAYITGSVPYSAARWPIYRYLDNSVLDIIRHTRFWVHGPASFWHGIAAMLLMLFVQSSEQAKNFLARPAGRFLGRISFPLYILHLPVLGVVLCGTLVLWHRALPAVIVSLLGFFLFVVVSVAIAALVTPVMEGGSIAASAAASEAVDVRLRTLRLVFSARPS